MAVPISYNAVLEALPATWRTFAASQNRLGRALGDGTFRFYDDDEPRGRFVDGRIAGYRVQIEPSLGTNGLPAEAKERRVRITRDGERVNEGTFSFGTDGRMRSWGFDDELPPVAKDLMLAMLKAHRDALFAVQPIVTLPPDTVIRGIRLNSTVTVHGGKRFVVVRLESGPTGGVPLMTAEALTGAKKGSLLYRMPIESGYSGFSKMRFPEPIWYGASGKARYAAYVAAMTKAGHPEEIVPLALERVKPLEPPPPLATSDVEDPEDADVVISHTAADGTIATYDRDEDRARPRDASVYSALRRFGFVVARRAPGTPMRRTNSVGLPQSVLELEPQKANALKARLNKLGLTVAFEFETTDVAEARAIKREYLEERADYKAGRAEKMRTEAGVQQEFAAEQAEKAIQTISVPGYFPTPIDIARRMAVVGGLKSTAPKAVLDPSAGAGHLLKAAYAMVSRTEIGGPFQTAWDAIEIAPVFHEHLEGQGFSVVGNDVLDPMFQPGESYDVVLMNPPYEKGASIDHVRRAWDFVRPGGRLVALLPESIWYREDKKHTAFRDWFETVPKAHRVHNVEAQEFGRAKSIKTRILVLEKAWRPEAQPGDPQTLAKIREARARVAAVRSGGLAGASARATQGIPFGQPILVGHHSESAHRKALERAERAERKRLDLMGAARETEAQAKALRRAAARGGHGHAYEHGLTPEQAKHEERKQRAATKRKTRKPVDPWTKMLRSLKSAVGADMTTRGYHGMDHGRSHVVKRQVVGWKLPGDLSVGVAQLRRFTGIEVEVSHPRRPDETDQSVRARFIPAAGSSKTIDEKQFPPGTEPETVKAWLVEMMPRIKANHLGEFWRDR